MKLLAPPGADGAQLWAVPDTFSILVNNSLAPDVNLMGQKGLGMRQDSDPWCMLRKGTFRDVRSQLGQVESPFWKSRGTELGQGCLISDQDHTKQTVGEGNAFACRERPPQERTPGNLETRHFSVQLTLCFSVILNKS